MGEASTRQEFSKIESWASRPDEVSTEITYVDYSGQTQNKLAKYLPHIDAGYFVYSALASDRDGFYVSQILSGRWCLAMEVIARSLKLRLEVNIDGTYFLFDKDVHHPRIFLGEKLEGWTIISWKKELNDSLDSYIGFKDTITWAPENGGDVFQTIHGYVPYIRW